MGVNDNQIRLLAAFQTAIQVFVQQCAGAPLGGHPQNILRGNHRGVQTPALVNQAGQPHLVHHVHVIGGRSAVRTDGGPQSHSQHLRDSCKAQHTHGGSRVVRNLYLPLLK